MSARRWKDFLGLGCLLTTMLAGCTADSVVANADESGGASGVANSTETASEKGEATPPNFIVVFCDDMGYADIGPFGAKGYKTPNLDNMASEGMKFTDFYVGRSFCSPSRAALLTGCLPTRVGINGNFSPHSKTGLHPDEVTIADMLKTKGYATACFGKWHLGHQPEFLPPNQGFDEYFGLPYSNDMWPLHPGVRHLPMEQRVKRWPHLPMYEGTEVIKARVQPEDQVGLTRKLTERALQFIDKHQQEPFFIYLPNPQPHVPLFASKEYLGKTARGRYGDVLTEIDWQMGQIIAKLKECKLDNNTLVIFTSDNGPWLSYGNHAGSAGPLREGKGSNFEGGFRVSCLMRWPGKIPAGSECNELTATIDVLPSLAELSGAEQPTRKIDGKSIVPLMMGIEGAKTPHEAYFYYDGSSSLRAVRSGKWKLIFPHRFNHPIPGGDGFPGKNEKREIGLALFDLESDIGETNNLAIDYPDVVKRLQKYAVDMRKELGDGKNKGSQRRLMGGVRKP